MNKERDEYIQEEIKKMEKKQWNSFVPKVTEIQEALKPLGYVVDGFREKTSDKFVVHLFLAHHFICINEGDVVNTEGNREMEEIWTKTT